MKNLKKRLMICLGVICIVVVFLSNQAWAATLSFDPSDTSVGVGDSVDVNITISGLEDENLAGFDFVVNYDDTVLNFDSYELGNELGVNISKDFNPFADAWDLSFGNNFIEISLLWDFNSQPDSFALGTLSFTGKNMGKSPLFFSDIMLSDDSLLAQQLDASSYGGTVNVVPIPSAIILLGSGLIGLIGLRKRCGRLSVYNKV